MFGRLVSPADSGVWFWGTLLANYIPKRENLGIVTRGKRTFVLDMRPRFCYDGYA